MANAPALIRSSLGLVRNKKSWASFVILNLIRRSPRIYDIP